MCLYVLCLFSDCVLQNAQVHKPWQCQLLTCTAYLTWSAVGDNQGLFEANYVYRDSVSGCSEVGLRSDKMARVNSNVNLNKCSDLALVMSIIVQQDAIVYSLLYFCKLLYVFRVVTPPIIRSTYNCNYSIWHWLNFGKCGVWSQLKWEVCIRLCYLPRSCFGGNSTHHQEHI